MLKSHYEMAVEKAQAEVKDALIKLSIDDPHLPVRFARLVGRHQGLEHAANIYRESARRDVEEEGI